MKKALLKDSIKEIKNTYRRFISILLMAFLGVGFFAGIRATSPDMIDTIDDYYKTQNVYDLQIVSILGLTKEDKEALQRLGTMEEVNESYETDGKIKVESTEKIAKFIVLSQSNVPIVKQGNLPQNQMECVVEESFLRENNKKIGDVILAEIEDTTNSEGETIPYLKQKEMKIVGTVQSPLYIARDRGSSKLGNGKINYYIYIHKENINQQEIYTSIYCKIKDGEKETTSSKAYEDKIEVAKNTIQTIQKEREQARHDQLVEKATQKVQEAQVQLEEKQDEGQKQLEEAQAKINDGKSQIHAGEREIEQNEKKVEAQFANVQKEIQNAKEELQTQEQTLQQKEQESNQKIQELEGQKQELLKNLNLLETNINDLRIQYQTIIKLLENMELTQEERQQYELQKQMISGKIEELTTTQKTLQSSILQIETGETTIKTAIENGKKQIQQGKDQLSQKESQYNQTKKTTYAKIEKAKQEIVTAKQELTIGENELSIKKQEYDEKIAKAQEELKQAKDKILEIENPTWYILDRNTNPGYVGFVQDAKSIESVGKVFPVVFFIVATLISLTSMTRMVEEQRMQIGTLKALGYCKWQIMSKYIIYAGLACIIGSILGMCVGFVLLPKVIWMMYSMMYQMTDISIAFNMTYGGTGLAFICICIIGATIYTVLKELVHTPAVLMRPKAPKVGNRVLLEKIPFIWKRLNFSQKVTIRNLFRYKKRFYMTIIGIMGCTALILTGFGIKDSITKIIPDQFEKVFMYDMQISLKDNLEASEKEKILVNVQGKEEIQKVVSIYMTTGIATKGGNSENIQIMVPQEESQLEDMVNIIDIQQKQKVSLKENEIALTDKAAQLLGVKVGDTIIVKNQEEQEVEFKISNIVENYVSHYIYMSKQTYENSYEEKYETNVLLTKNNALSEEEQDGLIKNLIETNEVAAVTNMQSSIQSIHDMMSLLNYVVVVLIVAAGLLAFVVLYNLANVNISERIRELATIKVLGFYDKEVYQYVTKETIILTAIGIGLGLVGGYFLTYYIIGTCEINMLRFLKVVEPISYLYATLITILFSIIVNIATYFSLRKIDMIESLKSVE